MTAENGKILFKTLARVVYLTAAVALFIWFSYQIGAVLLASLLALILAVALNVPVQWLESKNVPRGIGTAISLVSVLSIFLLAAWLVVPRLMTEIPRLMQQVPELMEALAEQITAVIGEQPGLERELARVVDWSLGLAEELWRHTDTALTALIFAIFVIALVLYMVTNLRAILRWYVLSMPARYRSAATRAFARASKMVIGWIVGSVILGGIKAVAAFTFLTLMQIPGALVWSAIAFLGAFVPRVGFYFMAIPPVLVAFTVSPMTALWTLLFYAAFSEILGDFVAPRIFAETMKLNAVFILIMTLALGYGFGLFGVLIATPIAGFIKAYYDEFYLARQPADPEIDHRVETMMRREVGA